MVPFLVLLILLNDVICNATTYIDDTNLYSKCDWAFLLLGFSSNLLLKCLVDFKGEKTKLCLLLVRKTLVLLIWKQVHLSLIKKYLLSFFFIRKSVVLDITGVLIRYMRQCIQEWPIKTCGRQKNLKWYGLFRQISSNFLKVVFHKF